MGRNVAQKVLQESRVITEGHLYKRVNDIGQRIVQQVDRRDVPYHFYVIDQNEKNAFAIPGGYVYLYTGLLQEMETDDEIACVLAHEIGHVVCRHSMQNLQNALGFQVVSSIVFRKADASEVQRVTNTLFDLTMRGYSRQQEREADRLTVRYASRAGYDPRAMITVLEKLSKDSGPYPRPLEWLSTHPSHEERILLIKQEIERINHGNSYGRDLRQ